MKTRHYLESTIPHPYKEVTRFCSLEEIRRAVSDMEERAREMGVHPAEVIFTSGMMQLTIVSQKLTDGSLVLNASIAVADWWNASGVAKGRANG